MEALLALLARMGVTAMDAKDASTVEAEADALAKLDAQHSALAELVGGLAAVLAENKRKALADLHNKFDVVASNTGKP